MINKNSGQSLIELIVAIVLLTIALTAGAMLVMRSLQLSEVALNRQRAVMIAKATGEYIRKEKEMNDWNVFSTNQTDLSSLNTAEFPVSISTFDNSGGDNVLINFQVEWDDLKGHHIVEDSITLYNY